MATHIIHISDTHFGPERNFEVRGAPAMERTEQVVAEINALPFTPDAIIHTGDVTNHPEDAAYEIAAEVFSQFSAPVYFATGNHDNVSMMQKHLKFGPLESLIPESENRLCYRASIGEIDALVLDAKVPSVEGPHGFLPDDQLQALSSAIESSDRRFGVFLHFPPRPIGATWIDKTLPVKNGAELHEILKSAPKDRFLGAFFGHLHRGMQIYDEGILYSAVSSPTCQFSAGPDDPCCEFLPDVPVCFNHISISESGSTQVKEYSFNS